MSSLSRDKIRYKGKRNPCSRHNKKVRIKRVCGAGDDAK
jgi:hypothetical protein